MSDDPFNFDLPPKMEDVGCGCLIVAVIIAIYILITTVG